MRAKLNEREKTQTPLKENKREIKKSTGKIRIILKKNVDQKNCSKY